MSLEQEFNAVLTECVTVHKTPVHAILGHGSGPLTEKGMMCQEAIVEHLDSLYDKPLPSRDIGALLGISSHLVGRIRGRIAARLELVT